MSQVIRTKVIGKRGNGSHYSKSFMSKNFLPNPALVEMARTHHLFENESHVYNNILPILGDFGPKCIFANGKKIILEDLREYGYVLAKREEFLDFNHIVWTFKTLARLHAKSLAWKLKDPRGFDELVAPLKEVPYPADSGQSIGKTTNFTIKFAIQQLKQLETQTEEIEHAVKILESYEAPCYEILQGLLNQPREKSHVLNHGDSWINNILFKYDAEGQIIDLKLIDYQIVRLGSPALDFHYFTYANVKSSFIEQHYDVLVLIYHHLFEEQMREQNIPEEFIDQLTLQWFKDELKKYSFFGLVSGIALVHAVVADETDVIDMTTVNLEEMLNSEIFTAPPLVPKKANRIKTIVLHYIRAFL
ncbi:uncharacterized protein [Prorops nasuta]